MAGKGVLHQARIGGQFGATRHFAAFVEEVPADKGIERMPLFDAVEAAIPDLIEGMAILMRHHPPCLHARATERFGADPSPERAFAIAPACPVGQGIEAARIAATAIAENRIGSAAPQAADHPIVKGERFLTVGLRAAQAETIACELTQRTVGRPGGVARPDLTCMHGFRCSFIR
jgi:hypothetical protein